MAPRQMRYCVCTSPGLMGHQRSAPQPAWVGKAAGFSRRVRTLVRDSKPSAECIKRLVQADG